MKCWIWPKVDATACLICNAARFKMPVFKKP
jgi:hypothetical protein